DGSASSDADGDSLTYAWTLAGPAGSTATLDDTTSATPVFTPDLADSYAATLTASDGTADSVPDIVTVTVTHRPVADAGLDASAAVGDDVVLDGSGSSDGDGDALTYTWSLTGPDGITETSGPSDSPLLPPFVPDVAGSYTGTLVVNDGSNDSVPDTVTITATHRPVAQAGADQEGILGQTFTLDGSGSFDNDGDALTYSWSLNGPDGSTAALDDATAADPSFTPDLVGTYTVNLVVNDSTFVSDSDSVIITVLPVPNEAPVAAAGTDQSVLAVTEVSLARRGSPDPDGDTLTYAWTLTGPDGSTATLADATTATPSFTPDLAGEYAATLVVNDGTV